MYRYSTQQPSIILLVIYAFLTFVSEVAADGKEKVMFSFFQFGKVAYFLYIF